MKIIGLKGALVRTFIYTIGHFFISFCCVFFIANATMAAAFADSIAEPILNAGWYFAVDRLIGIGYKNSLTRMLVYTIGHFCIAFYCVMAITNATILQALADSMVEPILNAGWYVILDRVWLRSAGRKA